VCLKLVFIHFIISVVDDQTSPALNFAINERDATLLDEFTSKFTRKASWTGVAIMASEWEAESGVSLEFLPADVSGFWGLMHMLSCQLETEAAKFVSDTNPFNISCAVVNQIISLIAGALARYYSEGAIFIL